MARSVEPHKHKHKKMNNCAENVQTTQAFVFTWIPRDMPTGNGTRNVVRPKSTDSSWLTTAWFATRRIPSRPYMHHWPQSHSNHYNKMGQLGPKPVFFVQQKKAVLLAQSRAAQRQIKTIAVLECASTQKQQQKWNRKRWERKWIQSKNTGILQ